MLDQTDTDSTPPWAALEAALREGDLCRVKALIAAGADIRYKRERGYDALIDAVHGPDASLLDILSLLIAHGVNLSGVSDYNESGLRVLSREGRFDGVRKLLDAGADENYLAWTPLHKAVALGTVADVDAALRAGAPLEARDYWLRTAWQIALQLGDLAMAEMLRDRGADTTARGGRAESPPLFFAIQSRRPEVVRWLLQHGADIHQTDKYGSTALIEAVQHDDIESVELLIAAGADIGVDSNGTALNRAGSREIILRLLSASADPADLRCSGQRILIGLPENCDALKAVSAEEFSQDWTRRFGAANPERMREPYWEAMVRTGHSAYAARQQFGMEDNLSAGPVWCADRFGQSVTLLPDGRAIQIGGEHEDFYDPDFCIYNDVFVHGPGGALEIYGYPEDIFPPTDFHTATLIGDCIYVIGSLGYAGTRRYGEMPVYRLDLGTLRMDRMNIGGDGPGWIYGHRATAMSSNAIRVWGGKCVTATSEKECHDPTAGAFVLDLANLLWRHEPYST